MVRNRHRLAATALVVLAATGVLSACGDEATDGEGESMTVGLSAQPDSLDPALSFSPEVWESLWLVYTPLLTYAHEEGEAGTELVPGLAEELPRISDDGRRYELHLRDGLEYSDGTPVRAGDFEHTIKRVLALESPGSTFFTSIEGAKDFVDAGRENADIAGIKTEDRTGEITVELEAPDATFANSLATTFAGLVPGDTPMRNMNQEPPPGVGPYAFAGTDRDGGFTLEQADGVELPGVPSPTVDTVSAEVVRDASRATEDVISGRLDYFVNPPAPDQLAEVRERYADRYAEFPTTSIYYFFMRPDLEPFDDRRVRRAVNLAIDQPAIVRLFGGLLEPTCNVIPPNVPGYSPLDPCPYGEPDGPAELEDARRLVTAAGAEGESVTVWGNSEPEPERVTEYLADALNQIGLDAEPRIIGPSVYFQTVGNERTEAQIGFANYFLDFPHPANVLSVVDGDLVQQRATLNLGRVDDPQINAALDRLRRVPNVESVEDQYAEVDAQVVRDAYIAPFGNRKLTTFLSERMDMDCVRVHPVFGHDYTSFCLDG
jgi:peptide/nickel transport system substrate-binding protein